jgi:alpha-tubulin suppressor-like RCC1 family protein
MSKTFFSCGDSPANEFDIGYNFVKKTTLIENYPWLINSQTGGSVLWVWGSGGTGRLGTGAAISHSSPVQTLSFGTNWRCVSAGSYHGMATKTDGTLWTWGDNSDGRLGDNTTINKSSPIQTISGGTNWKQLSASCCHSAAVKSDGSLWLWGANAGGRLGNDNVVNRSSPVQTVGSATTWKFAAVCGRMSTALKNDGTLWTWGCNVCGSLGIDLAFATTPGRSSPVQTVAGGTNWSKLSSSGYHVGAIKTDGSLWLWGANSGGQLGDGTTILKSSPVQTTSIGTTWKTVSAQRCVTLAITSPGCLAGWGDNFGALNGYGAVSPVLGPRGALFDNRFTYIVGGRCNIHGITTDGKLFSWGYNNFGQFGNNKQNVSAYGSPVQIISGGSNWRTVSAGLNFVMAIQDVDNE